MTKASMELLERSVKTLWNSGATIEELIILFGISRGKVREIIYK